MKYQVGDLIDEENAGLGYIVKIKQEIYNSITIRIVWFSDQAEYVYNDCAIDSWIVNKKAKHYPAGKQ